MENILITGGAGFLGSKIAQEHLKRDDRITIVDDLSTGHINNVPGDVHFKMDSIEKAELTKKFDRIYHFSSPASPNDFKKRWREIVYANIYGLMKVLDHIEHNGVLIIASSSEIYGQPRFSMDELNLGEVNTQSVRGVYDESKRLMESIAYSATVALNLRTVICRIFNTYGPKMSNDGRVINTFVRQALAGESLTVHGDGQQTRSFCYVDDAISQIMQLSDYQSKEQLGKVNVFNVGSDEEYKIIAVARLISDMTGVKITNVDGRVDDPVWRCARMTKTRKVINSYSVRPLVDGLKLTIDAEAK